MSWLPACRVKMVRAAPLRVYHQRTPVVLFRTESGCFGALQDRCAHRAVPLSLGQIRGEEIRCGYHHFRFGVDGSCAGAPDFMQLSDASRAACRVRRYHVREACGLIWIGTDAEAPLPVAVGWRLIGTRTLHGDVQDYPGPTPAMILEQLSPTSWVVSLGRDAADPRAVIVVNRISRDACAIRCFAPLPRWVWPATRRRVSALLNHAGCSEMPGIQRAYVYRGLLLTVLGVVLMGIYELTNRYPISTPGVVDMPSWVPFLPWVAPAYLAVLFVWLYLPLALDESDEFRSWVVTALFAAAATAALWLMEPTILQRPAFPDRWWNLPYHYMILIDPPKNIFPCGHIQAPVIGTWYLGKNHPKWRSWLFGGLVFSAFTIAVTWQHRPIDILIGTVIAIVAIGLTALAKRVFEIAGRSGG